jgi:hypothetical protein
VALGEAGHRLHSEARRKYAVFARCHRREQLELPVEIREGAGTDRVRDVRDRVLIRGLLYVI